MNSLTQIDSKMEKIILFSLLTMLLLHRTQAQENRNSALLHVQVVDVDSKQAIEFASIALLHPKDSSLILGGLSDVEGKVVIQKIPFGRYLLQVNFMGYDAKHLGPLEFSPKKRVHTLPTIELKAAEALIDQAEVTADKGMMQLGLDRKIFNVEKSKFAEGGTATDVLRNVPTLDVDQDGVIKLRGNQGVSVLINGKPSALTGSSRKAILDQIPAKMVESIEIITNPSAKFDPDGISGMINIVLKKNKLEGFSGNLSYSIGTMANKHNPSLGLNYRNDKVNLYGSYVFNDRQRWRSSTAFRHNFKADSSFYFDESSSSTQKHRNHFAKVGMDYYINPKNSISLSASIAPGIQAHYDSIDYNFLNDQQISTYHFRRDGEERSSFIGQEYNLNYNAAFKKAGQKLVLDATYSNNTASADNIYDQIYFDSAGEIASTEMALQQIDNQNFNQVISGQLDYNHPFQKIGGQMELGLKSIIRQIDNEVEANYKDYSNGEWINDLGISNHFRYNEQVHAAYGTFGQKIKKFSYQLGLRLEQALTNSRLLTTGEEFLNNYFSFFPSAHFNYQLPKMQQLQFAYSRRINRPPVGMLNPFISFTDPLNIHQGNPYLQPEYIHSLELSYAKYWEKTSLNSSLYYRHSTNVFRRMFLVDSLGRGVVKYVNFDKNQSYGVEMVAGYRPFKWWRMNMSANVYSMQEDGKNIGNYENFAIWGHGNWANSFLLPKGISIQSNIFYRAPLQLVIGNISAMWATNLSVSKTLLKGQGTLTLRVQDPFKLQRFDIDLSDSNYEHSAQHRWESRVVWLSFNYNFGKMDGKTRMKMRNNNSGGASAPDF